MARTGRPREWTKERIDALGQEMLEWFLADESRIYFNSFLVHRGLHPEYLRRFQPISEDFCETLKRVNAIQEERLGTLGLKNPVMPIFILKNKHGYADKQEIKTENRNVNVDMRDTLKALPEADLKEKIRELTEAE